MCIMDKSKKEFLIPANLLGTLGTVWAGTPTSISPLLSSGAAGSEQKTQLIGAGICDEKGKIVPGLKPALDVLGNACAFTRIYISGGPNPSEFLVYFAPGGTTASLINIQGNFRVDCPAVAEVMVDMTAQTIGFTLFRNPVFEADLLPDEALAFSGLIDYRRRTLLRSLADRKAVVEDGADTARILEALAEKDGDAPGLCDVMLSVLDPAGKISPDSIGAALGSLAKKGLVTKSGPLWHLSDAGLYLARRMLIFDNSLVLTAGVVGKSGNVSVAGFTCIQAGVHDILFIDASAGNVSMRTTSSAEVLDYVKTFLTNPNVHRNLAAPDTSASSGPSPQQSNDKKFCPQCGAPIKPGPKYCGSCGYRFP
jgi:hypothetical protein